MSSPRPGLPGGLPSTSRMVPSRRRTGAATASIAVLLSMAAGFPAVAASHRGTPASGDRGMRAEQAAHRPKAAVPTPDATSSVVTVRVGGDRSGSSVTPLAGAVLALYSNSGDTAPIASPWAQCTSDADGDCSFTIPDTGAGGANADKRFWVAQPAGGTPAGWYSDPVLRTGPGNGSGSVRSPYTFQTPALAGGKTYRSTADFMFSTDWKAQPFIASTGTWAQSRNNPPLGLGCGLDAALVLDLSASVGSALPQLKQTADAFVDALVGTPSRVAVFSFDQTSPSSSVPADHPDLSPVSTQTGADAVKAGYAAWTLGKGTNWDQALTAVAQASPHYQLVVVITDGNPTRFADPIQGDGSNTHFADVEGGVFAANAVKAKAERVVALGVGNGVAGDSKLNLSAISGPTAFDGGNYGAADYYQTTDFAAAGQVLQQIAVRHCANTLSVVKQIVPDTTTGEDVTGATPAGAGWGFTATPGTGLTGTAETRTTTADGTGAVTFTPVFPPSETVGTLHLSEAQQPGYELVTRGGHAGACTDLATGAALPVTGDATSGAAPGFDVRVTRGSSLSCSFYNRPLRSADITVDKRWIVNGVTYRDGHQPAGLTAIARLTGPGSAGSTPQSWGVARTGYGIGDVVRLTENVTITAEGCRRTGSQVTALDGAPVSASLPYQVTLASTHTTIGVTNKVRCVRVPTTPAPKPKPTLPSASGSVTKPQLPTTGATILFPALAATALTGFGVFMVRRCRRTRG